MTGLVLTISLLASFNGDAALPAATGVVYLSHFQRNVSHIERIKAILPSISPETNTVIRAAASEVLPYAVPQTRLVYIAVCTNVDWQIPQSTILGTSPIRGPDNRTV